MTYDPVEAQRNLFVLPNIKEFLPLPPCKILEVGCGAGLLAETLAREGYDVLAVDFSRDEILTASSTHQTAVFMTHSAYDDFAPITGPVDCVLSVEMIEHLISPRIFLDNARAILKPGGLLVLTTPYHGYLKNLMLSLTNRWDKHFGVDWEGGHVKFFSQRTLSDMLVAAGFAGPQFHNAGRMPYLWKSMVCAARVAPSASYSELISAKAPL